MATTVTTGTRRAVFGDFRNFSEGSSGNAKAQAGDGLVRGRGGGWGEHIVHSGQVLPSTHPVVKAHLETTFAPPEGWSGTQPTHLLSTAGEQKEGTALDSGGPLSYPSLA